MRAGRGQPVAGPADAARGRQQRQRDQQDRRPAAGRAGRAPRAQAAAASARGERTTVRGGSGWRSAARMARPPVSARAAAGTGTRRRTSAIDGCSGVRRAICASAVRQQPVREHRDGERLEVVGQHVVAAVEGGRGLRGAHAGAAWRAARRRAAASGCVRVALDEVDGVLPDGVGDVDGADDVDQPRTRARRRRPGAGRRAGRAAACSVEHVHLGRRRRGSPSTPGP